MEKIKPVGYLFNGRFYESLDHLDGKTMHEGNQPIPLYGTPLDLRKELIDFHGWMCQANMFYTGIERDVDMYLEQIKGL